LLDSRDKNLLFIEQPKLKVLLHQYFFTIAWVLNPGGGGFEHGYQLSDETLDILSACFDWLSRRFFCLIIFF
jgi:hypothetical protein